MKFVWAIIVVVVLATGGYFGWKKLPKNQTDNLSAARPTSAVVEVRDIHFAVSAAGDIGPADQVSVRPEVNGRIAELPVDIGDPVKSGKLLCRLDDKDLQIERTQRLAEIDGARLQVEKAGRLYRRSEGLFNNNLISSEQFEDAKTDFQLATNGLERAVHALHLVEDRLSKTKILAPFDCTVLTRPVSVGQAVSGSGGFNSGTEVMTIANLNEMIITAHINQADVIRLSTGQLVDVQVESVPGLRLAGIVERIAPQAIIKNNIKGFTARIQLKEIDPRVRPGMTAILNIPVGEAVNVLAVPLASVYTDPQRNERYVFIKDGENNERRTVRVGLTDNFYAEIQTGLSEGEIVSLGETLEQPGARNGEMGRAGIAALPGRRNETAAAPRPATTGATRPTGRGAAGS
jgi:RND family efflux transporter MFP subunit